MLGKLMKYEFKATARFFVPAYVAVLVLTVINRLFFSLSSFNLSTSFLLENDLVRSIIDLLSGITMFLYVIAICALFIFTFIIFVYRFYKNLLGDEGYLMMTLPVRPSQHIWAKLHVCCIWGIASMVICFLSIFILAFSPELFSDLMDGLPDFIRQIAALGMEYKVHFVLYTIELILVMLVGIYAGNMFYYACLALGHRFSKSHRILYSIGAYLVISFAMQVISVIGMVLIGFLFEHSFASSFDIPTLVHFGFIGIILCGIIEFIVFYLITENTLSKKLNLE